MNQINYLCLYARTAQPKFVFTTPHCLYWSFCQNVDAVDQSAILKISSISTEAFAAAEVATPRTECALKIEMSTAASASMLGRGCMVGQTNLSPFLIEVRTVLRRRVDKRVLAAGAKLAPFN